MDLFGWPVLCLSQLISNFYPGKVELSGGSAVKNPPDNAGDMGSIPDPGRSQRPQSSQACVPQLVSLGATPPGSCSRAWEPQLLNLCAVTTEACVP